MSHVSSVSELPNLIASAYMRRSSFFGRKEHRIAIIMQVNKEVSVEKHQLTFATNVYNHVSVSVRELVVST